MALVGSDQAIPHDISRPGFNRPGVQALDSGHLGDGT